MFRKPIALILCLLLAFSTVSAAPPEQSTPAAADSTAVLTDQAAVTQEENSLFPKVSEYIPFSDMTGHWSEPYPYVRVCVESGLMQGQGGGRFAPDAHITNAEVAAIAARIHAALTGTQISAQGSPWYQCYLDYLAQVHIPVPAPRAYATRQGFFELLSAVVPERLLSPINSITLLPDTTDPAVLKFYNAGILTGIDKFGTFAGEQPLSRAECAAMAARVVDPSLRRIFVPAGQVPAGPFPADAVVVTVNSTPITFGRFSDVMISLIDETQALYLQYGLVFDWEENYGNENWSWANFFISATLHSTSGEVLLSAKAAELGCPEGELAVTLFGPPTQAELDAYAKEHNITASPDDSDSLAELVLEEKLHQALNQWVDAADIVTTEVYDKLDPRELWEIYG